MNAQPLDVFACPLSGTRLIEASAGTGKTWNICGLYLRLLLERGLEVQQILVVTFTKTATAELRERIRSRIADTLAGLRGSGPPGGDPFVGTLLRVLREGPGLSDEAMALRLDLALQTFDEASIFTIHGFCQRALADTPFTSGMPMSLELLTDDSALRMEVVHDFWRSHVADEALPAALAAELLARRDSPERWGQLLKRQLAKPLSRVVWPAALDAAPGAAGEPDTAALARAQAMARATWQAERGQILATVLEAQPRLNGNVYKDTSIQQAALDWDLQLASGEALAAPAKLDKLDLFTPGRLKPKKGLPPPQPHRFFTEAGALLDLLQATRRALALGRQRLLRQLLTEGPARLRALKRERRVVAFDDMLFNLHAALTDGGQGTGHAGPVAALRARFPAALIDEFQDTDPLQFGIFDTVYGGSGLPLFLVGDPKQAIYSFRNADLHTYLQARSTAVATCSLAENQRSTRELLAGLNGLFSINPQAFVLPGLNYQSVACGSKPRPPWLDRSPAPRAPLQLWALPVDAAGLPLPKKLALLSAAQACAGEIARLLGAAQRGEAMHDGRRLAGGDIAVLVRSHAQGSAMRSALAALGVGSVELSQASIFQSPDAEALVHLLAAVLEPAREGLLRAALATELMGFDASGLDALAADGPQMLALITRFTEYRALWLQRGVGLMLRSLALREGVHARLLARADGERRLTNLLHLAELLHQAAADQGAPELLLRWLQAQRAEAGTDDAAQLRLESDRNLVQIVTIHKSKGLEYPVVFCPFLWDGHPGGAPNTLEGRQYHDAQGRPVLDFRHDGDEGLDMAAVKAQIALEVAAENLRLVYVALTRAVQRCYLVVGSYSRRNGRHVGTTESTRSRLNWLVAGAGASPAGWQQSKLSPEDIAAHWQAFARTQPGCVGLDLLPAGPWAPLSPAHIAPEALAALPAPAAMPGAWWIGSYSSLAQGTRHEGAAVDHDAHVVPPEDGGASTLPATPIADDDILNFPRGPQAGNCMHAVFERVDFTDRSTWPVAIAAAIAEQPPGPTGGPAVDRLARMLNGMLGDVLHTRLPGGVALCEVPRSRRLVELEFNLPAAQLTAPALAALLRAHGRGVPPLSFGVLQGYLRGFIDLVFEHGGRHYILDWKSNHLGAGPGAYAAAQVARAMTAHGYHLQALLYTVALHRYLRGRLPGYRYEQHMGGALYLFVRGVRPGWADGQGRATGVHFEQPPLALVEALSALLAGAPVAAATPEAP